MIPPSRGAKKLGDVWGEDEPPMTKKPKADPKPLLQCPECDFKTRSEAVFVRHLEQEHGVRPHQIAKILEKMSKS